ncbi:hypothetical protein A2Z67_02455 [Candidatus Woesebacteria bacterium RBG_13_36_22]|uniref:Uncharacterized protein n=1 Tax=Candidatus Woesebacteria bacterium RBG_13_36_22 TaxID=1802478 RepID=A0A1F7X192_9BACT|nr:MAG: hypothetical protein A2Z67_02455 [Candidatus Woesebacteria bacterium RBG_13_36_22]
MNLSKRNKDATIYIAEHQEQKIQKTMIYGWDPIRKEAWRILINGRIVDMRSTRPYNTTSIIGPCTLVKELEPFCVSDEHLDAIKNEKPF